MLIDIDAALSTITLWHWLFIGVALLIVEMIAFSGLLLGFVMAALTVSVVLWVVPTMSWQFQFGLFAASALIFTVIVSRLARIVRCNDHTDINNRSARLIASRAVVEQCELGTNHTC